MTVHRTQIPCE